MKRTISDIESYTTHSESGRAGKHQCFQPTQSEPAIGSVSSSSSTAETVQTRSNEHTNDHEPEVNGLEHPSGNGAQISPTAAVSEHNLDTDSESDDTATCSESESVFSQSTNSTESEPPSPLLGAARVVFFENLSPPVTTQFYIQMSDPDHGPDVLENFDFDTFLNMDGDGAGWGSELEDL
ncbi:hypothetical protein BDW59DRAFT_166496 [Aspergillus cavernicola]|uniref:Uncharacterized protein n=1 Tax=Aspergillus cavernicola TaxID=176166 RepID=A0ABR4HL57_9EURO